MRKLDHRGVAAFEFCVVALAIFTLIYAVFDLGRYVITVQSLRGLANAGARAMMVSCYTPAVISGNSPSTCTAAATYLPDAKRQAIAPFLYAGGLTPTVSINSVGSILTVTASQPNFSMMFPTIWGSGFSSPSASTKIPF